MFRILALLGLLGLIQEGKAPIPETAAIKDKEKLVRDLFKDEYKSKGPKERIQFAEKLLKQGEETKNDPAARYVLLRESMTIAGEEREFETAFSAAERISEYFEGIRATEMKWSVLTKAKGSTRTPEDAAKLAESGTTLALECWKTNEYDVALRALTDASTVAKSAKDLALITRVNDLLKEFKELKEAHDKVRSSVEVLAINDNDPEANAAHGWFLCLYRGEGSAGIKLLAKGPPDKGPYVEFTALALEETNARTPKEFTACAEKWLALAAKAASPIVKRNAQLQARGLFERAMAGLEGLDRTLVEKRVAELSKEAPPRRGVMGIDLLREYEQGKWKNLMQGRGSPVKENEGYLFKGVGGPNADFAWLYPLPAGATSFGVRMVFRLRDTGGIQIVFVEKPALFWGHGVTLSYNWVKGFSVGDFDRKGPHIKTVDIPKLDSGWHTLDIKVVPGSISAKLDGLNEIQWQGTFTPTCITAKGDEHGDWLVRDFSLSINAR
jgi:hypothetical protein